MKAIMPLIVSTLIFINGCANIASIDEYTKYSLGRNIEEKIKSGLDSHSYASRIGLKEKTYKLDNGNWVYVEADSKNCFIHWEVNPLGTIVGFKLEGNCH